MFPSASDQETKVFHFCGPESYKKKDVSEKVELAEDY